MPVFLKFDRPRRFFFHYNKPQSRLAGSPRLSLHVDKKCYIVMGIECEVKVWTKNNKTQPHCVVQGDAKEFAIFENYATIK